MNLLAKQQGIELGLESAPTDDRGSCRDVGVLHGHDKRADDLRVPYAAAVPAPPRLLGVIDTHTATTDALVREVFGEVHMLSHLVGAANRADIRRLSGLEAENLELKETLRRQQEQRPSTRSRS